MYFAWSYEIKTRQNDKHVLRLKVSNVILSSSLVLIYTRE